MTDKEAIIELKEVKEYCESTFTKKYRDAYTQAINKAIEALENQKNIIKELEKMKAKIEQMDFDLGDYYDHTDTIIEMVSKVIDKQIAELKGETNGRTEETL